MDERTEHQLAWHQALVFAVTGTRRTDLGTQAAPDLDHVVSVLAQAQPGSFAVPPDLMTGIGAAQFWAVLGEVRRRRAAGRGRPVVADRPLDSDERRLSADVPPHHG